MFGKIFKFLTVDIWRIRLSKFPKNKAFFIKHLRVILVALRGYREDKCQFRASALTFFTILSIVPILAMMFGIAKGFGMQTMVQEQIMQRVQDQPQLIEVVEKIIAFSNKLLDSAKGGLIAGIGIAILFVTVIRVLGNIENSFNFIWGIKKPRTFSRKFSDYLSVMLICPILLVLSSSATVFVSIKIQSITESIAFLGSFQKIIFLILKILPYFSLWVVFSFIFFFMPNTKVKPTSAILAGIVAGTIFQITQLLYIKFQIGVTRYNEIYGSFAALPLFLIWLQLSWFIVLFGAEVSFAHQNVETFELEPDCLNSSKAFRKKLSILITSLIAKNFIDQKPALSAAQIGQKLDLPIRLIRELIFDLTQSNIIAEVIIEDNKDVGYQPGRELENLKISDVITSLEARGIPKIDFAESGKLDKINDAFTKLQADINNNPANLLIKDIYADNK